MTTTTTYTFNLDTHERAQIDELARLMGAPSARAALLAVVGRELGRLRAADCTLEQSVNDIAAVTRELQGVVARLWQVEAPQLGGETRQREVAWARQNWYLLCRERLPHIADETLAAALGRDRSTVSHGITQARTRAATITSEAQRLARARLWLGL